MKLYKLKTRIFECYCVAKTYDDAVNKFYRNLNEQHLSYNDDDAVVTSVEVIADESVYGFPNPNKSCEDTYSYKLLV